MPKSPSSEIDARIAAIVAQVPPPRRKEPKPERKPRPVNPNRRRVVADPPQRVWKRGDPHPTTNEVFLGYRTGKKGVLIETWVTKGELERVRLMEVKWRSENKDRVKELGKKWSSRPENKKKVAKWGRAYRKANREKIRKNRKKYAQNNRKKIRKRRNKWKKERLKTDPRFAMITRCRSRINMALRRRGMTKGCSTQEMIGCDWEMLVRHIESQFTDGMSWENRSEWHIDHIVPLATAETEGDVIRLCHYTNLRPLWAADNIAKGASRETPTTPSNPNP